MKIPFVIPGSTPLLSGVIVGLFATSLTSRATVVFSDDFSEAEGTPIQAKFPDIGTAYDVQAGNDPSLDVQNGQYISDGAKREVYAGFSGTALSAVNPILTVVISGNFQRNGGSTPTVGGLSLYQDGNEKVYIGDRYTDGANWGVEFSGQNQAAESLNFAGQQTATFVYNFNTGASALYSGPAASGTPLLNFPANAAVAGYSPNRIRLLSDLGGDISIDSISVDVGNVALPAITQFTANKTVLINGTSVALTYATADALSATITPTPGTVPLTGTANVTPPINSDTDYVLTATKGAMSTSANLKVRTVAGGPASFRYVRFNLKKTKGGNAPIISQVAEFQFFNGASQVLVNSAANDGGYSPSGEAPQYIIDGDINTKWLNFETRGLIFDFGSTKTFSSYEFATGGDAPERDPVRWTMEGSNDATTWTLIDNLTDFDFPTPEARSTYINAPIPLPGTSLIPTVQITAVPAVLIVGDSVTLSYNSAGAVSATLNGNSVSVNGTQTLTPAVDTTYTFAVTSPSGSVRSASVFVDVVTPAINTINYANFTGSSNELARSGSAAIAPNGFSGIANPGPVLRLNQNAQNLNGVAWFRFRQSLSGGFQSFFDLQFINTGDVQDGADGIAFIIQNQAAGTGASTNFKGFASNSLNITFDSFNNIDADPADPSNAFVKITSGGTTLATANLADFAGLGNPYDLTTTDQASAPYAVRVDYAPGDMDIYINGVLVVDSLVVDLSTLGAVDGSGKAIVGFAASTGFFYETHDVSKWTLTSGDPNAVPFLITDTVLTPTANPTSVALTWTSQVGKNYTIDSSTNLVNWITLSGVIPGAASSTTGSVSFTAGAKRFFRVSRQP